MNDSPDVNISKHLTDNLKSSMEKVKLDIQNAFAKDLPVLNLTKNDKPVDGVARVFDLVDYLVRIKEHRITKLKDELILLQQRSIQLARLYCSQPAIFSTVEEMLEVYSGLLSSDGAILWFKASNRYNIVSANLDYTEGERIFTKILPFLACEASDSSVFSYEDKHFMAFTYENGTKLMALLFFRDINSKSYYKSDQEIGGVLCRSVFNFIG